MQGRRVDVAAWLRSMVPMWLIWALYAVPVAWLWSLWLVAQSGAAFQVQGNTVYDENGNLISQPPPQGPGAVMGLVLMLTVGFSQSVPPEGVVIALGFAAAFLGLRLAGRGDRSEVRLVASVGAGLALGPAVLAALVVLNRDEALKAIDQSASFDELGMVSMLRFLVPGAVSLVVAWILVRIGWGPLPLRADPAPAAASLDERSSPPAAASEAAPSTPQQTTAPTAPGVLVGEPHQPDNVVVVVPTTRREEPAWDELPTLPPDFRAPEPAVSPYARPSAGLRPGESAADAASDGAPTSDPYAAYRRPEVAMGERGDGGD